MNFRKPDDESASKKKTPAPPTPLSGQYSIGPKGNGRNKPFAGAEGTDLLTEEVGIIPDIAVPGREDRRSKKRDPRRQTLTGLGPAVLIEEKGPGRGDETTEKLDIRPVSIESQSCRGDDTLVVSRRDMELAKILKLLPEDKNGKALDRWDTIFANAVMIPDQNAAGINFEVFRENLTDARKFTALGMTFNLVFTSRHMFIVSKEPLVTLPNEHPELIGNANLTRASRIDVRGAKPDGSESWTTLFVTSVTYADVMAMINASTENGRIVAALSSRNETAETKDSLAPSGRLELVDVEDFRARMAMCTKNPKSTTYFDPKAFSANVVQVLSGSGNSYEITVSIKGMGKMQTDYHYRLYVYGNRDEAGRCPEGEGDTFYYGSEFCVLVEDK